MSLLSLASVGVGRDLAVAGEGIVTDTRSSRARLAQGGDGGVAHAAPRPAEHAPTAAASFGQMLVAQIPSEALLAYTTLLAVFTSGGSGYQIGRWLVYAGAIVVCAATVLASYLAQRDYGFADTAGEAPFGAPPVTGGRGGATNRKARSRRSPDGLHLPWFPMVAAVLAMAVYGLTVPGSALQHATSGTAFGILSSTLAVGGGIMMSIFAPFLGKGNNARIARRATRPQRPSSEQPPVQRA